MALISKFPGRQLSKQVGERKISAGTSIGGGLMNLAKSLLAGALKFLGKFVGSTFSAIWSFLVQAGFELANFNWAATDSELDAQIKGSVDALGSVLGGVVGNALGWVTCGLVPGVIITRFNPGLGMYILKNVGEEALEEFLGNMALLIQYTATSAVRVGLLSIYKTARQWALAPNNRFIQSLASQMGINLDAIRQRVSGSTSQPWTFAQAIENKIQEIPNAFLRNFVEEFSEEFTEACIEAGFVVAMNVDSYMAMQKMQAKQALGPTRIVEVHPNRETDETIVLAGPEQVLKSQITQAIVSHELLLNRDVGTLVGNPVRDYLRAQPQSLRLVITLFDCQTPPYGSAKHRITITIPNVKRSALDWSRIKQAVGGNNGYMWGRYRATVNLNDGRQMAVYCSSESAAKDRIKALLLLSDSELVTLSVSEEEKAGIRLKPGMQKDPTRIYPAYFTIFNRQEALDLHKGKISAADGNRYEDRQARIDLWPETEPPNTREIIQRLLSKGR